MKKTRQVRYRRTHLRALYKKARLSGTWLDRAAYLVAVYVTATVLADEVDTFATDRVFKPTAHDVGAYIAAIIDSTSKDVRQRKSEYRRALQYVAQNGVKQAKVLDFITSKGGIKACARLLSRA